MRRYGMVVLRWKDLDFGKKMLHGAVFEFCYHSEFVRKQETKDVSVREFFEIEMSTTETLVEATQGQVYLKETEENKTKEIKTTKKSSLQL